MKKTLSILAGAFFLLVLLGAGGWWFFFRNADTVVAPPDVPGVVLSEEQQAELRHRIEQQTSAIRGLKFLEPVRYRLMERVELRDFLVGKVREQFTEEELRHYGRTLATLGLVPDGTDLLEIIVSLYNEQVAAFYVPESRELFTFKNSTWTGALDRMLLAHELTHSLQDQNFTLTNMPLRVKHNDDLALATAALIEGDATVLMTQWYVEHADPKNLMNDLGAMLGQNTAALLAAPLYLREMLLFPYTQGQVFVSEIMEKGGFEAVNKAYRHPPRSTREILHPDDYLKGNWEPVKLEPKPVGSADWQKIGDNTLGEFGVKCLFQEPLGAWRAKLAAQGWTGDRFHVYEKGSNGPTGLIWLTVWDSEEDAMEFEEAYNGFLEKRRAARPVTARVQRAGRQVTVAASIAPEFVALGASGF
jgi:hypothetical protein